MFSADLAQPRDDPHQPEQEEDAVPEPEPGKHLDSNFNHHHVSSMLDGGHLVIDHVEVEDADGILLLLAAPQPGVAGVAAGGHLEGIVNIGNNIIVCEANL